MQNIRNYAANIRKIKRNCSEQYVTKNSKIVDAKIFENKNCFCSRKCIDLLTCEERKTNFENFWKMGNFEKQNLFLCSITEKNIIKQGRPRICERNKKTCSYKYYLLNRNSIKVHVCKKYFQIH